MGVLSASDSTVPKISGGRLGLLAFATSVRLGVSGFSVRGESTGQPGKTVEHVLVSSGVGVPTGAMILGAD